MLNIPSALRNFTKHEGGNVLITFGLTSLVAIAAVGGAVDFGRANKEKSKMQNVLDAALVSGVAKYRETADWALAKTEAQSVFQSTYADAVIPTTANPNPTAPLDVPKVTISQTGNTLSGSATMTVTTPFINMVIGRNMSTLVAGSSIPASGKQVEVAVMVDLTGSMGWSAATGNTTTSCGMVANPTSKLDYLKCAGEDLVNILLPASGANNNSVRVGIAPFADYVNAGPYAAQVTGLNATGGAVIPINNLTKTKQNRVFTGTYSGANTTGSQFGAGTSSTNGATVTSTYCAVPTSSQTIGIRKYPNSNWRVGVQVDRENDAWNTSVTGLVNINNVSSSDSFARVASVDGSGSNWTNWINWYTYVDNTGHFAPLPESLTGLILQSRTASVSGTSRTGDIGTSVSFASSMSSSERANLVSLGFKQATSSAGYWRLKKIKASGSHDWEWLTSGWYLPLYTSLTTTMTTVGCESVSQTQPSSMLISCVTERKNGTDVDYTADALTSGRYVGPFNHGNTSVANYSDDGKCYVAGRELPAVIPLTNSRDTLRTFFQNATAGGATPGHLGTAWASYLLSPNWNDVWPTESEATAYNSANIKKYAILMTDGEYNLQFSTGTSNATSAKQALMICKQMRDNGIHVFTVGFGFAANAAPPTTNIEGLSATDRVAPLSSGTAQQKALDTLAKCASSNSSYYFPYDGESLRTTFKSIASTVAAQAATLSGRLTD